jgi:hypothetical protein
MLLENQRKDIAKLTDGVEDLTHTLKPFILNVNASFERVNKAIRCIQGQLTRLDLSQCQTRGEIANIRARSRNAMLRSLDERLEVVKAFQWDEGQQSGGWVAPAKPPRYVRNFWHFGRCLILRSADAYEDNGKIKNNARFVISREARFYLLMHDFALFWLSEKDADLTVEVRHDAWVKVQELVKFYDIELANDRVSSSDDAASSEAGTEGTVIQLTPLTVEVYLNELAATWGLAWRKIRSIPPPPPNSRLSAGLKRKAQDTAVVFSPDSAAALRGTEKRQRSDAAHHANEPRRAGPDFSTPAE